MTEIPEHLLKRSRERRGALGEGGDAAATPSAPSSTPQVATPATPAVAAPKVAATPAAPKVKPDPPYVAAAKARQKMPFWAMGALSLLPVWGFMYLRALQPEVKRVEGPLAVGGELYSGCAGCHGGGGEGGSGRPFIEGAVLKTFPRIEDQLNFVIIGSQGFKDAGLAVYGDPNREGGAHAPYSYNGSPMQPRGGNPELTDAQIVGLVCHERYTLSGADPADEAYAADYEKWCSPEAEIYAKLEAGELTFASEELGVGEEARASTPKEG